ncbi:hypothetical protein PoB_002199900 [Plakobranchus ocellatus]|uniref:Transmembrane protein n=1 Tax=Plakobranchus ocellatus TaxID=259542 RepID=A0AAV3ZM86_9GAST|nr:hypothetical protein PoB_002199900 [Plakobranchus ocellatus]
MVHVRTRGLAAATAARGLQLSRAMHVNSSRRVVMKCPLRSPLVPRAFHDSLLPDVAREPAVRSAGTLLSRVRAPLPTPWPDGGQKARDRFDVYMNEEIQILCHFLLTRNCLVITLSLIFTGLGIICEKSKAWWLVGGRFDSSDPLYKRLQTRLVATPKLTRAARPARFSVLCLLCYPACLLTTMTNLLA